MSPATGRLAEPGPLHTISVGSAGPRIAFLHGLFGQGRNWMAIAKAVSGPLGQRARCTLVDLPDHGRSPWSETFSYASYAASVAETLKRIAEEQWTVVGHSLGGKVAMVMTLAQASLVGSLVVVDIAPRSYGDLDRFRGYIDEMRRLPLAELGDRADAERRFNETDPGVKAFLLQNLRREGSSWRWQANLDLVAADADAGEQSKIAAWPIEPGSVRPFDGPVLWINGAESRYVNVEDRERMHEFFPRVRQLRVKGAGHWVHTEAPEVVIDALNRFVAKAQF